MSPTDRYHHGDLPNALRRAAVQVIGERGVGGFSLREVARRAGVSHAAPKHHFGDVRGLLTSIATEGFTELERTMSAATATHDDPVEQLMAIGEAYVDLARTHPAHCAVMFRPDLVEEDDDHLSQSGLSAYEVLEGTVRRVIEDHRLAADVDVVTWMYWSTIQGLVELENKFAEISKLRGRESRSTRDLVRSFTEIIVRGADHA